MKPEKKVGRKYGSSSEFIYSKEGLCLFINFLWILTEWHREFEILALSQLCRLPRIEKSPSSYLGGQMPNLPVCNEYTSYGSIAS
jgi:hypothetical protein